MGAPNSSERTLRLVVGTTTANEWNDVDRDIAAERQHSADAGSSLNTVPFGAG
jgi:hypothetical protein